MSCTVITRTLQQVIFCFVCLRNHNWEGFGLVADVNEYVDNTIHMIVPFIQEVGLDPMVLPDIEEGFEVVCIFFTYKYFIRKTF